MAKKSVEYEPTTQMGSVYPYIELQRIIGNQIRTIVKDNPDIALTPAPKQTKSDYGVQLSAVAKKLGKNPLELTSDVATRLSEQQNPWIESVVTQGPYLNFRIEMSRYGTDVINHILKQKEEYGKENVGHGNRIIIDMSSPNIAKRMSYGHLRSTIIGDAVANILRVSGYEVIKDNHIGDWGTQFGKLIVALQKWGNEGEVVSSDDPIGVLQDLYVKFHEEAEKQSKEKREGLKQKAVAGGIDSVAGLSTAIEQISKDIMKRKKIGREQLDQDKIFEDALDRVSESDLEKQGREWFLKLEQRDPEARRIWKLCVDLSMKEFDKIYNFLGVKFDITLGESFYEGMLKNAINTVKESGVGQISDGALVVDMESQNLGTAIVQKSDGASIYMTRDIAAALYREQEMKAVQAIYVVGEDQKLYFRQLFEVLKRMGLPIGETSVHVYFGMVSLPEGKMSTRKGRVILLKDVITEGIKRTEAILQEKNPELYADQTLKEDVVRKITVGAMKWSDLSQDPKVPIVFDWDKALNLEGNSALYVQYQTVRANNLLNLSGKTEADLSEVDVPLKDVYQTEEERELIKILAEFPVFIDEARQQYLPAKIASYAYDVAKKFSRLYDKVSVLGAGDEDLKLSRLKLAAATSRVLTNSLSLLGIEVPSMM